MMAMMMLLMTTLFALPTNALYFFMNGNAAKCFYEELPKDTLVVGKETDPQSHPNKPQSIHMETSKPIIITHPLHPSLQPRLDWHQDVHV